MLRLSKALKLAKLCVHLDDNVSLSLLYDENKIKKGNEAREDIQGKSGRMYRGR